MNNNNNQYPTASAAMGVQPTSRFASLMGSNYSNSDAMIPPTDNAAAATTATAIPNSLNNPMNNSEPSPTLAPFADQSPRPLWRNGEKTFPYKLYDMLEFAETSGNTDICSWLPSGDSFVIHDRKLFTELFLPRFFLHKKWRSFVSIYFALSCRPVFFLSTAPLPPQPHLLVIITPLHLLQTRQLNIWCFKRDFSVTVSDAYCHQFFRRGEIAKIACVERAESKNMFKKDPITNKRKPAKFASLMRSNVGGNQVLSLTKKGSEGSAATSATVTTSVTADPVTKNRRVTSNEEEDVMDVASFLAGLKSSPDSPRKTSGTTSAPVSTSLVGKSAEGGTLSSSSSSHGEVNNVAFASRMNMLPQQSHIALPYPNHQAAAASSIVPRPSNMMSSLNGNIMGMNNQAFGLMNGSFDGTFDRESLSHMSTDQLVALASRMKLREKILRERAMSFHPAMAPVGPVTASSGWRDSYNDMLLQQQPLAAGAGFGAPSQGMSTQEIRTQGMMRSLLAARKPKPLYGDVADLQLATTNILNVAQNNGGYPRAA